MQPHRIAAGAIVPFDGKVLLVRYAAADGSSFLVAPGGRVEANESVADAAARETREETCVSVAPRKLLLVEDLNCIRYRMCKIWFLADFVDGLVQATDDARAEGIIEARWFSRAELQGETVYPSLVTKRDWAEFESPNWLVSCAPLREVGF